MIKTRKKDISYKNQSDYHKGISFDNIFLRIWLFLEFTSSWKY